MIMLDVLAKTMKNLLMLTICLLLSYGPRAACARLVTWMTLMGRSYKDYGSWSIRHQWSVLARSQRHWDVSCWVHSLPNGTYGTHVAYSMPTPQSSGGSQVFPTAVKRGGSKGWIKRIFMYEYIMYLILFSIVQVCLSIPISIFRRLDKVGHLWKAAFWEGFEWRACKVPTMGLCIECCTRHQERQVWGFSWIVLTPCDLLFRFSFAFVIAS